MNGDLFPALWQGLLIFVVIFVLFGIIYFVIYWFSWGRKPHWLEGFRDRFKLSNLLDNRFWPWIHQDTKYWIVRLRFDKEPVVVEGEVPLARYWSLAYYPAKKNTLSIDTQSVKLDEYNRYRITIGKEVDNSVSQQTIKVDADVKRGIIELRVTLVDEDTMLVLPRVSQNNQILIKEGEQ